MQYPLPEQIGNPDLLVGREKEFREFDRWLRGIPGRISKSRVILARRKSGKTSFVQRIFNQLWTENGAVIPLYFDIPEKKIWYPNLAVRYYCTFASQYISFLERDPTPIRKNLSLEEIRAYGLTKSLKPLADDADFLLRNKGQGGNHDMAWELAYSAPHSFAGLYDQRFLVIIDEFQNITQYVYRDEKCETALDDTLAGSYHYHAESKIAPMLVTGSYVGWLVSVINKYLEAGRLKRIFMAPHLTPEAGLQAAYKYAEISGEPVTHETAALISRLYMADPFFISCVIQSTYEDRDLTTPQGVIDTVNSEITDRDSEMSMTWGEYIELTLQRVNDIHAKNILLHLSKHADREWTPGELKEALHLDISKNEIHERLVVLAKSDVILEGQSDIRYRGLQDGTLCLILRNRFEEEIQSFVPDLRKGFSEELEKLRQENRSLRGMLNHLSGQMAEYQLANELRTRKRFALSAYSSGGGDDTRLNVVHVATRVLFQRSDGKGMEIDVRAESDCGRVVLAEVKKTKEKMGLAAVEDFHEKAEAYSERFPGRKILPAFLSLSGFTDEALKFCQNNSVATADHIDYFQKEWS